MKHLSIQNKKECFIKKIVSVLMMIMLIFLLVSCDSDKNSSLNDSASDETDLSNGAEVFCESGTSYISDSTKNISSEEVSDNSDVNFEETSDDAPDEEIKTVLTFRVNENMPIFRCDIDVKDYVTLKIDITDTSSNKLIQSIVPPDNEMFTKNAAYFVDITFSGNLAILIPLENSANYVRFVAYAWDSKKNMFTEIPSFSEILNPSINADDKLIYATRTASQITSYSMIEFKDNEFLLTRSLCWWPAIFDGDDVSNAEQLMHCEETSGPDAKKIINDFYVPWDGCYDIDINDEQMKPYFEEGSLWDLNSSKWDCEFYNELIDINRFY